VARGKQCTLGAPRLWGQRTEALEAGNGGSGARVGDTGSRAETENTDSGVEALGRKMRAEDH